MADTPQDGPFEDQGQDGSDRREQSVRARLTAADERDLTASARDKAAAARDNLAAARHQATLENTAAGHELPYMVSMSEQIIRAAGQRKRAARNHAQVAAQSALAFDDRRIAAHDRELSAYERLHALVDREMLADALADAEIDPLTGARMRAAGLADLDRELLCCHRTGRALVVVYVDVIGLKTLNDTEGHRAGDELLVRVVALLKQHLRTYDLVVRLGGDEFLCALGGVALADVRQRFVRIAATLAAAPMDAAIRIGFAQLAHTDTAATLIARADEQMIGRGR